MLERKKQISCQKIRYPENSPVSAVSDSKNKNEMKGFNSLTHFEPKSNKCQP